ncbi:DUF1816 domain-containing protein [Leptolyngbya ohadii]|uniref:DUF1816 domain-containing protein n=1 Tax=Leptolyngbya ohadii TaxID=1962290 RepID=UPI000B59BE42|nr:DUF1816 domain-containing protein [Leptolyngbya ohadii]
MNEFLVNVLEVLGLAWWVEVVTETPKCTYYFGPFATAKDAKIAEPGYIQDLQQEGAIGIRAVVKRCKPAKLTVFDEEKEMKPWKNLFPVMTSSL